MATAPDPKTDPVSTNAAVDVKAEELAAMVREIHDRVKARYPGGAIGGFDIPIADLLPLLHARDAAEGKVAAVGSVNPRRGGPVNAIIQSVKRQISRGLNWFIRDQVEYNRAVLRYMEETLTALNDVNRSIKALGEKTYDDMVGVKMEARELKDIRSHWVEWREAWQTKLMQNEISFLRSVSDLQASFNHRVTLMDAEYRESLRQQHAEFTSSMEKSVENAQKRFWDELEKIRVEYERLIHDELKVIRQKMLAQPPIAQPPARPASPTGVVSAFVNALASRTADAPSSTGAALASAGFDYTRFEARFRGSEDYVREHQRFYLPFFQGKRNIVDIGCGRGEFLELLREAGATATGIDLDAESVGICRAKGLQAEVSDMFTYLERSADASFDGILCSQVVEHLRPEQVPTLVKLAAQKLERGGILAIETPNPECLAIFATHFYLDPTHTRPVPPPLLRFYFEEFGFGDIEQHGFAPAQDSMASLKSLPPDFRDAFFGNLDYCLIGRRL